MTNSEQQIIELIEQLAEAHNECDVLFHNLQCARLERDEAIQELSARNTLLCTLKTEVEHFKILREEHKKLRENYHYSQSIRDQYYRTLVLRNERCRDLSEEIGLLTMKYERLLNQFMRKEV